MKHILYTLSFVAVLLLGSCKSYKNVQEPEFRDVQNVKLLNVGLLQSTAGIDLIFYNPNNLNITLSSAYGDVYLDSVYFGRFELAEKVSVKKNSEFILPAIIKLDNIGAIKNKDILQKEFVNIRIDGTSSVSKAGFSKEIPIRYEKTESTDKLRALVSR